MQKKIDNAESPCMIAAMHNPVFAEMIGQESVKASLSLYIDAFAKTNRLPFISLVNGKGGGKSFTARLFRSGLKRIDGSRPPILEVNAASIQSSDQFFSQVYPVWTAHKAVLFLDEIHALPHKLCQIFLSVLDVRKEAQRSIEIDGQVYDFDFTQISFISATTNQEKLPEPLRDRLRMIAFEDYKPSELFEIFERNLEHRVFIEDSTKPLVMETFRGNPRDAVVKAEDLKTFSAAKSLKSVSPAMWSSFMKTMGVNQYGLSHAEMRLVKILGERKECTLSSLANISGFDAQAIRRDYESILIRKGLMEIDGKRRLSANGIRFYHAFCK